MVYERAEIGVGKKNWEEIIELEDSQGLDRSNFEHIGAIATLGSPNEQRLTELWASMSINDINDWAIGIIEKMKKENPLVFKVVLTLPSYRKLLEMGEKKHNLALKKLGK